MTEPNKKIKLEYNPETSPDNHSNNLENVIKDVLQNIQKHTSNSNLDTEIADQIKIKREIILAEPNFSKKSSVMAFSNDEKSNVSLGSTKSDEICNSSNSIMTSSMELSRIASNETAENNNGNNKNLALKNFFANCQNQTESQPITNSIQHQTEEERNKDKRERNKLAARRCRKRKMDKIHELKTAVQEMGEYFVQIKTAVENKQANDINLTKLDDLIHLSKAVVESDTVDGTKYILGCIQAGTPIISGKTQNRIYETQVKIQNNNASQNSRRNSAISIQTATSNQINENNTVGQISPELETKCSIKPNQTSIKNSLNTVKIVKLMGNHKLQAATQESSQQINLEVKPDLLQMLASNLNRS